MENAKSSLQPLTDDVRRKLRHELAQLTEQLAVGANGPDFPWERLQRLSAMDALGQLGLAGEPRKFLVAAFNSSLPVQRRLSIPVPVRSTPASALEKICSGIDEAAQKKHAELIDGMWAEAKKNADDISDYPAICVAVYKTADWLGLIRPGTKSRMWVPALLARYGVSINEGIRKYNLQNPPPSTKFRMAVVDAFDFMVNEAPSRWTRDKTLPEGYGKFR